MLPKPEVLVRLLRANISFVLYGQKASGKTKLIKKLFDENKINHIEINCTLANKKSNFLKLFNVELTKQLKKRDLQFTKLKEPHNLDSWINQLKKNIQEHPDLVSQLDNLYVFMDNIEQMVMSESFVPSFYTACQKQFPFKFNFVFCGTNFHRKQYALQLPFRTMISFCQKKPQQEYENIIHQSVQTVLWQSYKDRVSTQQIQKCCKAFTTQIKNAFDNIQFNLDKIRSISRAIVQNTLPNLDQKNLSGSLSKFINHDELKKIIQQVREHGPLQDNLMKRKITAIDNQQTYDLNPNLEYYPNLILTSIHMADYYQQKQDKRRFQDYKNRTTNRNKQMKRNDFKIGRHNINRIIAISDALESQAKQNQKERALEHHSLDYYAQFQHLKKMNRLKYTGNKVTGIVKEEQAKAFMAKVDLKYQQFMGP